MVNNMGANRGINMATNTAPTWHWHGNETWGTDMALTWH